VQVFRVAYKGLSRVEIAEARRARLHRAAAPDVSAGVDGTVRDSAVLNKM
jgi:hypothetical protein